ncbi:hypothetical protein K431DRAFT_313933 [Polychaeton citri CBS 116435]|uniref:Uncharacterized protein n=1 Tax=Polychaeton citri CBS 116435 TaxID=1314669 RepID=A0A9P4UND3_9PEZI|nr:hypothetical protein K431DRAFT_313933 [Polychaeton citri CBS 116435]
MIKALCTIFLRFRSRNAGNYEVVDAEIFDTGDYDDQDNEKSMECERRPARLTFSVVNCILLCSSIIFVGAFTSRILASTLAVSGKSCIQRFSANSPVEEAIELDWVKFYDPFTPDAYSGPPNDQVEAAWARLWDYGVFTVPLDKIALLNQSSIDGTFRLVETERGIEVGALLEGAHQIHCVNLVRQYIYRGKRDYSGLPSFSGGKHVQRHHVDHCLNTILMNIKCWSDVIPFVIEQTSEHEFRKKGTLHRCRRFESHRLGQ